MLIISFDIKGIVHKEIVLAGQGVNSAYYCDVLQWMRENVRRLRLELWRKKNMAVVSRTRTVSHFLFHQGFFYQKTSWLSSPTHPTFLFSPIEDKTESRHFDTTEVIQTELQAVLTTLTEHNFQDAFKKWQKRWERCIRTDGKHCESVGGQ
jgi:hypothetical protein